MRVRALALAVAGAVVVLGPGVADETKPAQAGFPGSNGLIAFANDDGNGDQQIYLTDRKFSLTQLTDSGGGHPAWSPNGRRLAFSSSRDGNDEIYIMKADGTDQTRLTNNPASDGAPAWSPDGSKIVFQSNRDGNREIYVMSSNGSGQIRLTNNPAADSNPAWSPDGSTIAFDSDRDLTYDLYLMNEDGTGQTNLTNHASLDASPDWSPDGSKIAFSSFRDAAFEVYIIEVSGGATTKLTNSGTSLSGWPAWSPDGTKIAFHTVWGSPRGTLYVTNVACCLGAVPIFSTNSFLAALPAWQPLPSVGGIAELPVAATAPLETSGSSGPSVALIAIIAVAGVVIALTSTAWYAKRRRGG